MNSAKKTALWLIKTSCYLSIVAFAVIYICSFMWLKMGMGETQTIFNHAVMEANTNLTQPNVRVGDLIIAKEYLYSKTPDIHDVVVYSYNDQIHISIIEKINEEDDNVFSFKVTPYNEESSILLYKEDIIGELYIVADGLGKLGMFLVSPMFILILYSVIGLIIILLKSKNKATKTKTLVVERNEIKEYNKLNIDLSVNTEDNLSTDKSLMSYHEELKEESLNESITASTIDSTDNFIDEDNSKDNNIIISKKDKRKRKRASLSKRKPNKKHYNRCNHKKKIKKKKKKKYNCKKKPKNK